MQGRENEGVVGVDICTCGTLKKPAINMKQVYMQYRYLHVSRKVYPIVHVR